MAAGPGGRASDVLAPLHSRQRALRRWPYRAVADATWRGAGSSSSRAIIAQVLAGYELRAAFPTDDGAAVAGTASRRDRAASPTRRPYDERENSDRSSATQEKGAPLCAVSAARVHYRCAPRARW